MDNSNKVYQNSAKIYTGSAGGELFVSTSNSKQTIVASNNRAQYYADLAKKYRDEAKLHCDNAMYYAEQNSDVTFEYIDGIKAELENNISTKQEIGDYALKSEIPVNTSELNNDSLFATVAQVDSVLPSQNNNEGKILITDGSKVSWQGVITLQLFDTVVKDHILTYEETQGLALQGSYVYKTAVAGSRYGYPDFYQKCLDEKSSATATSTTLGSSTITIYENSNGHKFYDIADKSVVDTFYNTYGIADFYGVDTTNERIFLPRNKYFHQFTLNTSLVNDMNTAGLPNITGTFGRYLTSAKSLQGTGTGAFSATSVEDHGAHSYDDDRYGVDVVFNASKSNSIYGKSKTVQPPSSNKLLYYCVGNTANTSAITSIVQITNSENDNVPLGFSMYSTTQQSSPNWLKSSGQWNSGKTYSTFYNWLISEQGTMSNIKSSSESFTDYDYVINLDSQTFRLPLLNGSETLPSNSVEALTVPSTGNHYFTADYNGYVVLEVRDCSHYRIWDRTDNRNMWMKLTEAVAYGGINLFIPKGHSYGLYYQDGTLHRANFVRATSEGSLYFKVGNSVQNLELLDVSTVMDSVQTVKTALSNKINKSDCKAYITSVYVAGTSGYILWSNKYCEQWGESSGTTVTFLKSFANTNYSVSCTFVGSDATMSKTGHFYPGTKAAASMTRAYSDLVVSWRACGYVA